MRGGLASVDREINDAATTTTRRKELSADSC